MLKTWGKTAVTMDIGAFIAKETIMQCPCDGTVFVSEQLRALVPDQCTFGFDVIIHVGYALFVHCRSNQEIVRELAAKNISISERAVSYLGRKFIIYLALAHHESRKQLKRAMKKRGGYILHLDGTCEGDSPNLFCSLDGISELVLENIKIPSENSKMLIPFLRRIKKHYGAPLAIISDMGAGIMQSVKVAFPNIPLYICHFHFLRDIGRDILSPDYEIIINRLKKLKVRSSLRERAKYLEKRIGGGSAVISDICVSIEQKELKTPYLAQIPTVAAYALINWAFQAQSQSKGYGFPFDRPHLEFVRRLKEIYCLLDSIMGIRLREKQYDNKPFFGIYHILKKVFKDKKLNDAVKSLEEKSPVFDRLREAMRIALPEGKNGLNDDGVDADIMTIEKQVNQFRNWLTGDEKRKKTYAKMIEQLDKYWPMLFADPIVVNTPEGKITILPQRTNNLIERFFRKIKRWGRRKGGNASLSRTLKVILADTPLVRNLENDEYVEIILDGCQSLEERFSQIDSKIVCEKLNQAQKTGEKMAPQVKKIISQPDLPEKISALFAGYRKN